MTFAAVFKRRRAGDLAGFFLRHAFSLTETSVPFRKVCGSPSMVDVSTDAHSVISLSKIRRWQ
ncbi:hypothetical protein [Pandoraea pulmonicola]|uniref:hypothetical protein n=1 Tax=Pandoraea pulmonicola TaxID=93221 RepID=UPI000580014D|nr:hypothetical protein [Pandoraea pulmonicola]